MGFFKKIGNFVKKAAKQVSFKNVVKIASGFDPSGIIGGMQAQHEQKKLDAQAAAEQAAYDAQVAASGGGGGSIVNQMARNPNFGQILGGAMAGAGTVLASGQAGQVAGAAGATLVDNTMSEWFKRNWLKVVGGAVLVIGLIVVAVRLGRGNRRR